MKTINISICACGKYLEKGSWKQYRNIREVVLKRIHEEAPKAKVIIKEVILPEHHKDKKENHYQAKLKDKEERLTVSVKLCKCNLCEKEGTKYFEAIIQIRSPNLKILEDCVLLLQSRVENLRHRGVFINKIDRYENGFDLYMTHNRIAQTLGREIIDAFGGRLKISPRLFSKNHQTSKDIFRVNILVQLPEFSRGDIIVHNEKVYRVEKLGKKIKLVDMVTGAMLIEDYEKLIYVVLKSQQTYVSKTYPALEVINPNDFQSSMVKNRPKYAFTTGQQISVVVHRGIYVVE